MTDSITLDMKFPAGFWPESPRPREHHRIPWRGKRLSLRRRGVARLPARVRAQVTPCECAACGLADFAEAVGIPVVGAQAEKMHRYCTAPADGAAA